MGTKYNSVREACNLDADMRSEENINDILDFVKDVKFFTKLTVLQQRTLCKTMTIETFGPREFIFQKDDIGDKFYIILTGNVSVQVPTNSAPCPNNIHTERCDCANRPLETVVFLEKGMGFGELALQSDQPRSATILTSEKTETLVTKRADYEQYAGQLHRQFIEQRVKFLRRCPRIEDALQRSLVSTQDIAAMANCLNESSLSGNEMAVRQGGAVDHMIFVRSGQLAMLRLVDVDACREAAGPRPRLGAHTTAGRTPRSKTKPKRPWLENDEAGENAGQSKLELSTNLAKAMMEFRKQERHSRLVQINEMQAASKQQEKSAEGADGRLHDLSEIASATADHSGRHGSVSKATSAAAPNPVTPASGSSTLASALKKSTEGEDGETTKGKAIWSKLQGSLKQAKLLKSVMIQGFEEAVKKDDDETGEQAAKRNVEHFADVSAARRRFTEYRFKQMAQQRGGEKAPAKPVGPTRRQTVSQDAGNISKALHESGASNANGDGSVKEVPRRKRLLRIGTVGTYQYFGDRQVCNGEVFPVSLVSDPIAEIYLMSKHDILRRLPKKLFSALFSPEKEAVPSDQQLLDMHRQTERWEAFRRSMHGEALTQRNQGMTLPRTLRDPTSTSRIDAAANLEFLGVRTQGILTESLMSPPSKKGVALTAKDEEHFSQSSATFLRRFDKIKQDPGLRVALAKAGLSGVQEDLDDKDPMAFHFEQHWSKLREDPIGLDLGEEIPLEVDTSRVSTLSTNRQSMNNTRRMSQAANDKRHSTTPGPPMEAWEVGAGRSERERFMEDYDVTVSTPRASVIHGLAPAPPLRRSVRSPGGDPSELPPVTDAHKSVTGNTRRAVAFASNCD